MKHTEHFLNSIQNFFVKNLQVFDFSQKKFFHPRKIHLKKDKEKK